MLNSSSSGCLQNPSDLISPSYFYSNDPHNQLEYENNTNELLSNMNKHQKLLGSGSNNELLSEEDLDFFVNQAIITQGLQSSRHNGTHELVPNLIA